MLSPPGHGAMLAPFAPASPEDQPLLTLAASGHSAYHRSVQGWMSEVLKELNQAQVRYLVVGGVAVVLHGHLRATGDLDIVLQLESDNLALAMGVFAAAGYEPKAPVRLEDFSDAETRAAWIRDKHLVVFSLRHRQKPGAHVDLFVSEPFDFEAQYALALRVTTNVVTVPVVSVAALIDMKQATGRAQDVADCEALRVLQDAARDQENDRDG